MKRKPQKIWLKLVGAALVLMAIFISIKTFSNKYEIINEGKLSEKDGQIKTVVAFGDSLISGVGSTKGNDFISLLSKEIGQPILNLGKSGDTTTAALTRIDSVVRTKPDIVIVLLGGNDYLRKVNQDETFKNLEKIVKTLQDNGAVVILLGVRGGLLKDTYEAKFRAFAKSNGTAYVPNVLDNLLGDKALMSDAIHPNDIGYQKIADKVLPTLVRFVK